MSVATLRVKVARGIATGAAAHALGAACLVASEPEAKTVCLTGLNNKTIADQLLQNHFCIREDSSNFMDVMRGYRRFKRPPKTAEVLGW